MFEVLIVATFLGGVGQFHIATDAKTKEACEQKIELSKAHVEAILMQNHRTLTSIDAKCVDVTPGVEI